jgi:hypothetical protein
MIELAEQAALKEVNPLLVATMATITKGVGSGWRLADCFNPKLDSPPATVVAKREGLTLGFSFGSTLLTNQVINKVVSGVESLAKHQEGIAWLSGVAGLMMAEGLSRAIAYRQMNQAAAKPMDAASPESSVEAAPRHGTRLNHVSRHTDFGQNNPFLAAPASNSPLAIHGMSQLTFASGQPVAYGTMSPVGARLPLPSAVPYPAPALSASNFGGLRRP